nr:3-phosphoglycerate kinase [uncultured Pseudomonas sp.]
MKKYCCVLLALLPLGAFAYPIEVEKQLNGAEVSATTVEIDHNMGAVRLYNYGQAKADCTVIFRNGPETPRTRKVALAAGETNSLTYKSNRSIIRLRVELTCGVD